MTGLTKANKMEPNSINQVSFKLGYSNLKKTDPSTKAIVASLDAIDSVSISSNQNSLQIDSLSLLNRKVNDSISQTQTDLSQKDLVDINKKLLEKSNNISNGIEPVSEKDKNYFSAENTANRIYNFASSFYETYLAGTGKEDSEASRKEYKDIIGGAIDEGFGQALSVLGELPDSVSKEVQSTHSLIFEKLDRFVSGDEQTYSQKVTDTITSKVKEIDKNNSGDLTIEETNLSADNFKELDTDKNNKLSIDEISKEYKKLDVNKDLSPDLVDSILNKSKSYEEIATEASGLVKATSLTFEFLSKNPKVAQAVISLSKSGTGDVSFSKYLENHPEEVKKILEDPSKINDVIRKFKLDAVIQQLQDSPITKDFLDTHQSELENLYNNPKLLDYFKANKESAKRLVDSFSTEQA